MFAKGGTSPSNWWGTTHKNSDTPCNTLYIDHFIDRLGRVKKVTFENENGTEISTQTILLKGKLRWVGQFSNVGQCSEGDIYNLGNLQDDITSSWVWNQNFRVWIWVPK